MDTYSAILTTLRSVGVPLSTLDLLLAEVQLSKVFVCFVGAFQCFAHDSLNLGVPTMGVPTTNGPPVLSSSRSAKTRGIGATPQSNRVRRS